MKIGNTIVALALMCVSAQQADAQRIGVKAGANFATMTRKITTTTVPNTDIRVADDPERFASLGGGFFFQFGDGLLAFQPELLFLSKGARFVDPATGDEDIKLRLNYFELPVLVKATAPFGVYVFGGPAIAYEGNCLSELKQTNAKISSRCNEQNAAIAHRHHLDYNIHAGAGYRYQIGSRAILLEARQMWGLRDIDSDDGIEFRNKAFAIMLGYTSAPPGKRGR